MERLTIGLWELLVYEIVFQILFILQQLVLEVNLNNKEKRGELEYNFPQAITKWRSVDEWKMTVNTFSLK